MQYKTLWNTNIKVSKICMWTMVRWNWYKWTEKTAHDKLDMAFDYWVNFLDTAEVYAIPPQAETQWKTEKIVWNWVKKKWNRNKIIIATKVAWPHNFDRLRNWNSLSSKDIHEAIEWSLKRLQTDYIDLYQIHRPKRPVSLRWKMNFNDIERNENNSYEEEMLEILETLNELQNSGKIRYFGLSNETPWWVMKFLELSKKHNLPRMQSIQNAYNLNRREYEIWLSEISLQEKVWLLAYSPLAWWVLSGKYQWWKNPKNARYSTRWKNRMTYYAQKQSIKAVDDYIKIADELWISVTQLALAWINDRNFVTSNIIWTTDTQQLQECLSSSKIKINKDTYNKIDEIFAKNSNPACW